MAFPSEPEVIALQELLNALRPLDLLTKTLCSDQLTVLQADTIFSHTLKKLQTQHTSVARKLHAAVKRRYRQRRNISLLSCLHFLNNPEEYSPTENGLLQMNELQDEMIALCTRLFPELEPTPTASQEQQEPEEGAAMGLEERPCETQVGSEEEAAKDAAELREALQNIVVRKKKKAAADIGVPVEVYCATQSGYLSDRLQKLKKALESVQASSVEAERAFSTAGRFVTKIRSKMGDSTLDSYCFAHKKLKNQK